MGGTWVCVTLLVTAFTFMHGFSSTCSNALRKHPVGRLCAETFNGGRIIPRREMERQLKSAGRDRAGLIPGNPRWARLLITVAKCSNSSGLPWG
jgi:hypothetical protein